MKSIVRVCVVAVAIFAIGAGMASAQGVLFVENDAVGVGVATPGATLHVVESDSAKFNRVLGRMEGTNFEPQFEYKNAATGKVWRLGSNPSGQFVMNQTDDLGVAELLITPDGVVRVNGTQVHPDYVFESDYDLMSIDELRSFVDENRHLPGVISSEKANGTIDLSSFPLQLLEKVEELTLYTIQQHDMIEELQRTNAELKSRLEAVESR